MMIASTSSTLTTSRRMSRKPVWLLANSEAFWTAADGEMALTTGLSAAWTSAGFAPGATFT